MPNLNNESLLTPYQKMLGERREFKDKLKAKIARMNELFGDDALRQYIELQANANHLTNFKQHCTETHHPLPEYIATSPYLNTPEDLELILYLSHIEGYDSAICRQHIDAVLNNIARQMEKIEALPSFMAHWKEYRALRAHDHLLKTLMNSSKSIPAAQPTFSFGDKK